MLISDDNGCMCNAVRAQSDKPSDWKCLSCRGREREKEIGYSCKTCGVGTYPDTEGDQCTKCKYAGES